MVCMCVGGGGGGAEGVRGVISFSPIKKNLYVDKEQINFFLTNSKPFFMLQN